MPTEIIKCGTKIDFIRRWKICAAGSLVVLGIGLIGIPVRGFRMGIDFVGGTEMQVRFTGDGPVGRRDP